ncbi:MAG: cytochrome b562 [Puniceicoccaceae bacterium]
MKLKHLTSYLFLSLLIAVGAPVQLAAEEEHTPLGESMEEIGGAWRRVKRQASDPSKNQATLAMVARMQAAVKEGMKHKPALLEDIPAAEKKDFLVGYGQAMKAFATKLDKLADLLAAGDNDGAVAVVVEIDELRKKGHTKYKAPDE